GCVDGARKGLDRGDMAACDSLLARQLNEAEGARIVGLVLGMPEARNWRAGGAVFGGDARSLCLHIDARREDLLNEFGAAFHASHKAAADAQKPGRDRGLQCFGSAGISEASRQHAWR